MNRFTAFAAAAATVLAAAAPAFATQTAAPAQLLTQTPQLQRVVMQCDTDQATRRSFARQHGSAPVFVTADQALAARASGEVWAAPRCMTAREHARLTQALTSYASVR